MAFRPLLSRLSLLAAGAGAATLVLAGCVGPTTVIGRSDARGTTAGQRVPNGAAATAQRPQILIRFKSELMATEMNAFRAMYGLRSVGTIPSIGVYVEEVAEGRNAADVLRELQLSPLVAYAELNQTISLDP